MAERDRAEGATRTLAENRRAFFDYQIERRIEAGIALLGSEIKSVRGGHVNLRDGYARVENGEVWLRNVHIAPWTQASYANHEPTRPRKLLLHRSEIGQLAGELSQKGFTLVPLRLYVRNGVAKVELGVARGKKRYDKREAIRRRELEREVESALRRARGR
jgi:SsrA-binding protein